MRNNQVSLNTKSETNTLVIIIIIANIIIVIVIITLSTVLLALLKEMMAMRLDGMVCYIPVPHLIPL